VSNWGVILGVLERIKRKFSPRPSFDELDNRLAQKEHVFKEPPLTPEIVAAIKLISPQFDLKPD